MADRRSQSYEHSEGNVPTTSSSGDSSSHSARNSFFRFRGMDLSTWNRPSSDQSASHGESSNSQQRQEQGQESQLQQEEQNDRHRTRKVLYWAAVEARAAEEESMIASRAAKTAIVAEARAKQDAENAINDKSSKNEIAFEAVKSAYSVKSDKTAIEEELSASTASGNTKDIKAFELKLSLATKSVLEADKRAARKLVEAKEASERADRYAITAEIALTRASTAKEVSDEKERYAILAKEKLASKKRLADEPRAVREARELNEARTEAIAARTKAEAIATNAIAARDAKMLDEDKAKIVLEAARIKEAITAKEVEELTSVSPLLMREAIEAKLVEAKAAREAAEVRVAETRAAGLAEEIVLRAAKSTIAAIDSGTVIDSEKSVSGKIQQQLLEFSGVIDDLMEKKEYQDGDVLDIWKILINWREEGNIKYELEQPIERKLIIWTLEEFNKWQERKVEKDRIE